MDRTAENLRRIREYNARVRDEWDESKHPRAANGQFGSGGGSKQPAAQKSKAVEEVAQHPLPKNSLEKQIDGGIVNIQKAMRQAGKDPAKIKEVYDRAVRLEEDVSARLHRYDSKDLWKSHRANLQKIVRQCESALFD